MKVLLLLFILVGSTFALQNQVCPVAMDDFTDPQIWLEHENKKVFFCCETCREDFQKEPIAYLKNLTADTQARLFSEITAKFAAIPADETPPTKIAKRSTLKNFIGRFHPVAVHFPIALILATLLAELMFIITKRHIYDDAAFFMIITGTVGAVIAAILGWLASASFHATGNAVEILDSHMWQGGSAAVFAVITLTLRLIAYRKQRVHLRDSPKVYAAYRVFLVFTVILLIMAGHLGGSLVYGEGYFSW